MKSILAKWMLPMTATALAFGATLTMAEVIETDSSAGQRATRIEAHATVVAIETESRNVTLEAPDGQRFTVHAPEEMVQLDDVHVGDTLRAAYIEAIAGEVRKPTEAELAAPWVELSEFETGKFEGQPVTANARGVRAVCTVEGMNRLLGTATVIDARGGVHFITEVDPASMEGITLGETVVIEYLQAIAVTLEPVKAD